MRLSFLLQVHREAGINDPHIFKALFLAGGAGAGKSYVSDAMFKGTGVKLVNSDLQFQYLLKKHNLPKILDPTKPEYKDQMINRETAKQLTDRQQIHWLNGMLGLVIDGTARELGKITTAKQNLENWGYDTAMVFINTTLEQAIDNDRHRAEIGERSVGAKLAEEIWNSVQANKSKLKSLFGANFLEVSKKGRLEGKEEEEFQLWARRQGMAWLTKPLKNPRGLQIIEILRNTGGKLLSDLPVEGEEQKAASSRFLSL